MKTVLMVIAITILLDETRAQECVLLSQGAFCSDVTFENGNPIDRGPDNPRIEEIMIFDSSIPSIPPGIFSNFTEVTLLTLNVQAFTMVPGAFNGLTNLTELNLRGNNFKEIPKGVLTSLTKLERLNLANNKITELTPGSLNLPTSLSFLDLSDNEIAKIKPGSLDSLINLKHLDLNSNLLNRIQPGTLNSLSNLVNLNLEHNFITKIDRYSFKNLANLEYLNLGNTFLIRTIVEEFSFIYLSKLIYLNLQYNYLKKLEPDLFQGLQNLEHLQVNNNHLASISKKILDGLTKLKVFLINNNNIPMIDAQSILNSLPKLESISLDHNALQCGSLPKIVEVFENHNVRIIRNNTKDLSNVYGTSCLCNRGQMDSEPPSLNLNPHLQINGCEKVTRKIETRIQQIDKPRIPGNVKTSKENATENSETPEEVNFSTDFKNVSNKVNVSTIVMSLIVVIIFFT